MARKTDPMGTRPLGVVVGLTGASALVLQVVWQRIISLHSGVDLTSTTTVVAGFLAGLGLGSILGGRLADQLGPARSVRALAAANVGIAAFAWFSTDLFYDLERRLAPSLGSRPASFAFNTALLLVPTVLEGLSLPLVARVVGRRMAGAASRVGRLYGVNTFGAAVGAFAAGWVFMGEFGFVATTRIAAGLNLVAALLLGFVARAVRLDGDVGPATPEADSNAVHADAVDPDPADVALARRHLRRWYLLFGIFGAVALGLEQVFFRLIDVVGRSNSYSFSLVLAMYLGCWGVGAIIGSSVVRRTTDHRSWFLRLQFSSGAVAAAALLALVELLPRLGLGGTLERWLTSDGFAGGFPLDRWGDLVGFGVGIPALLMGVPVLLLGAAYPFAQAVVTNDARRLGRSTGTLAAANICGSVVGTLLTGFVLIDAVGTAGTLRLLCATLAVGLALTPTGRRRRPGDIVAIGALAAMIVALPDNRTLWAFLVGADRTNIDVAEDHSCGSVHRMSPDGTTLVINGSGQNGHPFDDFHVLIGLLPTLLHDDPDHGLAIGFGIGSTTAGLLAEGRVDRTTTVELCGGNYELARRRGAEGTRDFERIFADPRADFLTGDGRRHLVAGRQRYDAVVVDTLRPTSANAGSHYSVEFHELVASRLTDGGVFAQWVPSTRVLRSAAAAFPYVVTATVENYNESVLFLGSNRPIDVDRDELLRRFDAIGPDVFAAEQRQRLRTFLADWKPVCVTDGNVVPVDDRSLVNTDLAPLDEYFLNRRSDTTEIRSAC